MDPDSPFAGTLLIEPRRFRSPVLVEGERVATIRRSPLSIRHRFAIHGADGERWASGSASAISRTRGAGPLVALRGSTVMLRDGPILTLDAVFILTDVLGRKMATLHGTTLLVDQPVLTLLQAIGLAHVLRQSATS
jgi:hypothetical protein